VNRPKFDWTINLGHILTFLGFLISGFMAYQNLDKRVIVLEQSATYQARRDDLQEQTVKDLKIEIRDALKDVHNSLEKLSDKIDKKR
jgi:hypothetical protein